MLLAHRAGISVFATGGIGGVHRGYEESTYFHVPRFVNWPLYCQTVKTNDACCFYPLQLWTPVPTSQNWAAPPLRWFVLE